MGSRAGWVLRAAVFALAFGLLQLCWQWLGAGYIGGALVHTVIVGPAAACIDALTPAAHVHAVAQSLQAPGGGLNVRNGCEGVEALFLLWSAVLAAPRARRSRWRGLLEGTLLLFGCNELRIVALFYTYRSDPALFDVLHATVTPIALVLVVCVYFNAWLGAATPDVARAA